VGGKVVYPRTVVGGEGPGETYVHGTYDEIAPISAWDTRVVPDSRGDMQHRDIVSSWFRYIAFDVDNPKLDWRKLNPERDLPRMTLSSRLMDATNPDLSAFFKRNGKLIIYHGWADFGVDPLRTLEYFRRVEALLGTEAVKRSIQLYLVPGMFHCRGGRGTDRFDLMTPLINWVEGGTSPSGLIARRIEHGKTTRTRPLCPYPTREHYRGSGNTADYRSFDCIEPDHDR
jgi:feruloyl esterase